MAKLKAPLFSFGASGKLAGSLVYMSWKGLNTVRQYVIPTNPDTDAQDVVRKSFTAAVAAIHAAQVLEVKPLVEADQTAMSALASTEKTPRTWFNEIVSLWRKQNVKDLKGVIYRSCYAGEENEELTLYVVFTEEGENSITKGKFFYGKTPTSLIQSVDGDPLGEDGFTKVIPNLTVGQKYYWQFRPSEHADFEGANSGIYHGTPKAA